MRDGETQFGHSAHRLRPVRSLKQIEKRYILATVKVFGGRKAAAARALGISLKTLYNRLNCYEQDSSTEVRP